MRNILSGIRSRAGRIGGQARSQAKTKAARQNARLPRVKKGLRCDCGCGLTLARAMMRHPARARAVAQAQDSAGQRNGVAQPSRSHPRRRVAQQCVDTLDSRTGAP